MTTQIANGFADSDLTFVFQGPPSGSHDVRYAIPFMRKVFPGSKFILATQASQVRRVADYPMFDDVVLTEDPGSLPSVKFGGEPHNVNRQITTSMAGLAAVRTSHVVKMRTDAYLNSRRILDFWQAAEKVPIGAHAKGAGRLLAASLYTLNPRYDERIPYHVSDWIHFGRTEDVRKMWTCPLFDFEMATYYERHQHADGSFPRELEFRSRFGTEQWLTLNYLFDAGRFPISYHNHCSPEIIAAFEEALVDNFVIVHPMDIDLEMPKHRWTYTSKYANSRMYSYEDWRCLAERLRGQRPELTGHTVWPRTPIEKLVYLALRRKRRLKRRETRPTLTRRPVDAS